MRRYPPVPAAFLDLCGAGRCIAWMDEVRGLFKVRVGTPTSSAFAPPAERFSPTRPAPLVVEAASALIVPELPPAQRCAYPPSCLHGRVAVARTVGRRDSPNRGRQFFVCAWTDPKQRCAFFRWADELQCYSDVVLSSTRLSLADVERELADLGPDEQLAAWRGLRQGTPEWHKLRACRVTASNFGAVHRTNAYCKPRDLLRSILWPANYESCAMKYGSVNEKVALERLSEYLGRHAARPDLPWYIDEPGIWISAEHPYLAGSPNHVIPLRW